MIPCYKKIICLVLAWVMFTCVLTGCNLKTSEPGSSIAIRLPNGKVPGSGIIITTPPVTEPTVMQPPVTEPTVTQPPVTEPTVTQPPVTEPPAPPATKPPIPPVPDPPVTEPTEPPVTEPTEPPVTEPTPTLPKIPASKIPDITAKNAFIFDTRTNHFLYSSADTKKSVYPASITKLFTSYVALQYLQMDDVVTVGSEVNYVASDASVAGFRKGDVVTVSDLIYGALLPSGCDASYILAAAAGRVILGNKDASAKKAVNAFVSECNQLADSMGMTNTNLANPDGYHNSNHYFSLQALAIVGMLALEHADLAQVCNTASITITYKNADGSKCTATFQNTNKLVHSGSQYYHELAVGLKTGTTAAAGACLLAAYRVDGGYILVGVLGCTSNNARFTDANALFRACVPYCCK